MESCTTTVKVRDLFGFCQNTATTNTKKVGEPKGGALQGETENRTEEVEPARDAFALYQNEPNPFLDKTVIGFYLPTATTATLTVYDETGRMIYTTKGDFAKGRNAFAIQLPQVDTDGMLYYRLSTATDNAVRKMVQVKN